MVGDQKKSVLFIAYTNLKNPLIWSQGIPYLKKIAGRGWRIFLLTFENKNSVLPTPLKKELGKIEWRFLYHCFLPILPSLLDICRAIIYCFWLIKKEKIALVQARSYLPGVIGYFLKKIVNVSFVFDMRGLAFDEEVMKGRWQKKSLIYKIAKFFEKRIILSADSVVVISNSFKNYLEDKVLQRKDDKIKVVPICVEIEKFREPLPAPPIIEKLKAEKKMILVYTGALEIWHCLNEMIDFFIVLKKRFSQFHFLILTYQKEKTELLIQKFLEKKDYTILTVRPDEVPSYLQASDLGIVFIRPAFPKNVASFPIKFLEYLAAGLPVVVNSGISEVEEIVTKAKLGVVVNQFNEESYQKAVQDLLTILSDRQGIKKRAELIVQEKYSLDLATKKYEEIYQALISYNNYA
jgi:glycosyltransferase involved in cell wall biosynthesis